jgi:hypothetical protein
MMKQLSIAAITGVSLSGAIAKASELPSYELMGFPISPHQFSVLGSPSIKEQSPSPLLTMAGMPASPHQIVVLTARPRIIGDVATTSPIETVSFSKR